MYKCLNIQNLYQDILFLKKSVMLLLSKEQLAAIQLVGYTSQYLTGDFKNYKDKKQMKSYFEKQQDILNSCDLQCKYVNKFFQKCQIDKNYNNADVNKRILYSIKQNQAKL
ncbi:AMP-binding enzyme family protein (macronuclear) [Tetrahymena thermophila SB210]|uniref:AMP-binding enzyme family protein n=1 Tax=Tetrahymena thermophila (strain SB210) TaxID=312017 RepID=W7XCW9_TETTS|nr:AMP-binding enzyme family protein [Tetrahymena thermophila SB210]EWS74428.1 AMP-binding enzyme family protein [Tetrahymena thermophila SB210]|eukprot:XP_012653005.1 AMP-binding enzyme family protein [Tetrahymena thermophila SB210]